MTVYWLESRFEGMISHNEDSNIYSEMIIRNRRQRNVGSFFSPIFFWILLLLLHTRSLLSFDMKFVNPSLMAGCRRRVVGPSSRGRCLHLSCGGDVITPYVGANKNNHRPANAAIVGGGLAGLSTAYHLLEKSPSLNITIFDSCNPGEGGASSVAGGFLHPLSPTGKLVYMGLEGLSSTNKLVQAATQFKTETVLRDELYRVATTEDHVVTLQKTAKELPNLVTWIDAKTATEDDAISRVFKKEKDVLGALWLHSSCKVLHMPSYLQGLWSSCQSIGTGHKEWIRNDDKQADGSFDSCYDWKERLAGFDCVVFAAGAGLFQSSILEKDDFPIQLVRGQSLEMTINDKWQSQHALLCGKYLSPLPDSNRILIGATHEFKTKPLKPAEVVTELKHRSYLFASSVWETGTIDQITEGYRVQSNRGKNGRLPIIGRLESDCHRNSWIFTGLSSRGLLYHGVFGDALSNMILQNQNKDDSKDFDWWRKQ